MARVLIIDDSETVIRAVRALLTLDGHSVEQLDFFVDLAAVLKKRPPDVVILDLDMPGFSGLRLGAFLRDQCHSEVPVVIYSSRSLAEIELAASKIGNAVGVEKGAPMMLLRAAVMRSLDLSKVAS